MKDQVNGDYIVRESRIADRRIMLAGYRLADLLTRLTQKLKENSVQSWHRLLVT